MDMLEAFVIMQCINMLQGLIPAKVKSCYKNPRAPSSPPPKKKNNNCGTNMKLLFSYVYINLFHE